MRPAPSLQPNVTRDLPAPMRDGVLLYADTYRPAALGEYPGIADAGSVLQGARPNGRLCPPVLVCEPRVYRGGSGRSWPVPI
jgi:predicted acyl esterase